MGRSSNRGRSGSVGGDICTKTIASSDSVTLPGAIEAASFLFQIALTLHSTEFEEGPSNVSGSFSSSIPTYSNRTNFLHTLMRHRPTSASSTYQSIENSNHEDIRFIDTFLQRASYLDHRNYNASRLSSPKVRPSLLTQSLLQQDQESGYSPLHEACFTRNLLAILLMLRYSAQRTLGPFPVMDPTRYPLIHPMKLLDPSLQQQLSSSISPLLSPMSRLSSLSVSTPNPSLRIDNILWDIVSLKDKEGLTPLQLLSRCFVSDFLNCRQQLSSWLDSRIHSDGDDESGQLPLGSSDSISRGRSRSSSFQDFHQDHETDESSLHFEINQGFSPGNEYIYGCEIMTFGNADHCALGTPQSERNNTSSSFHGSSPSSVRPKRVEIFALGEMGREFSAKSRPDIDMLHSGPAIAVAAGKYHSLVATQKGHLYAFGLGKGGRLGTGNEQHCPLPVRILGPLEKRHVVAVSAGTNHSLCVTMDGAVYAWGQNGFGQLGLSKTTTQGNASMEQKFLPRRLETLRHAFIVMVAAGERHSMALSKAGEVFCWGDNKSGQLGVAAPSDVNSSVGRDTYLPTRLNNTLLVHGNHRRFAISIAASEFSSLVLTRPFEASTSAVSSKINSVFEFGHGNHIPCVVTFPSYDESIPRLNQDIPRSYVTSMKTNPVAIACAKYHNVAITDDGRVYTWGLHSSDLGTSTTVPLQTKPRKPSIGSEGEWEENSIKMKVGNAKRSSSSGTLSVASPQLVRGMLPEYGGGRAVQVAASENHTCVLTDAGNLYTWGAAFGNEVLGHDGAKYVSTPQKVPGVHRAVGLASAKEHTILMLCTKFPSLPKPYVSECPVPKLQDLVTRKIAAYIDMFNAVPVLNFAERIQSYSLIDFCNSFIRCNLDGILSVGRKSEFESYLNEVLRAHTPRLNEYDEKIHPLLHSLVKLKISDSESYGSSKNWVNDCLSLAKTLPVAAYNNYSLSSYSIISPVHNHSGSKLPEASERARKIAASQKAGLCSNIETAQLALDSVIREVRTIKKKLAQISDLGKVNSILFTPEQVEKVQRQPFLEADLNLLEPLRLDLLSKVQLFESLRDKDLSTKKSIEIRSTKSNDSANTHLDNPQQLLHSNDDISTALKLHQSDEGVKEKILLKQCLEQESTIQVEKPVKFFCSTCSVSCPDDKSYKLHLNGRKHFNTLRQKNDQSESLIKSSIGLGKMTERLDTDQSDEKAFTWGKSVGPSVTPRYNLPIPSRALSEISCPPPSKGSLFLSFEPVITPKKSFRQIMEEEEKRSSKEKIPEKITKSFNSLGPMKKTVTSSMPNLKQPTCLSDHAITSPILSTSFTHAAPSTQTVDPSQTRFPWAKSQPSTLSDNVPMFAIKKSIYEIQQDEINFKAKEDKGIVEGKWYIGQRERAPSICAIQQEESDAKELQTLIEEQRRIEEQIINDLKKNTITMAKDNQTDSSRKRRGMKHSCKPGKK